jgi:hypothetical protein
MADNGLLPVPPKLGMAASQFEARLRDTDLQLFAEQLLKSHLTNRLTW